jgi:hypothetical protein
VAATRYVTHLPCAFEHQCIALACSPIRTVPELSIKRPIGAAMELSNPYGSRRGLGSEGDDTKELRDAVMEDQFKRGALRSAVVPAD